VVVVELLVGKQVDQSVQIGVGAAKGRFWGTIFKTLIGVVMFFVALVTAFPLELGRRATAPASPPATAPAISTLPAAGY